MSYEREPEVVEARRLRRVVAVMDPSGRVTLHEERCNRAGESWIEMWAIELTVAGARKLRRLLAKAGEAGR